MSDQTIFGGTFAIDYVLQRKLFSGINKPKQFQTYDGFKNFGSIEWATSFDISSKKDFSLIKLSRRYRDNPSFYKKYDNYNAIECSCLSDVPVDFEGIIGVPITFVKYKHIFDKEGFVLLWHTRLIFPGYYLHNTGIFDYLGYDDKMMPSPGEVYRKPNCILDGKVCYHRFFIQKKEYCSFKFPPAKQRN